VNFTEALKTVTYILRMHTAQTRKKRSDGLHRSTENRHLQAEGAQPKKKDQVDFTEALKTATYTLRMHRQGEKIRWTSQKH